MKPEKPQFKQDHSIAPSDDRNLMAPWQRFLTEPVSRAFDYRTVFWLLLSLVFSMMFASRAMRQAFSSPYVLQDDWRHHVFWMSRLVDPDSLPGDLIADYFQSIAPTGYKMLYSAAASAGIHPFLFAKLLPMALGLITTAFCFAVSMQLLPVPTAAFAGSLLLNQSLWMRNGLVSATPRAFISPLFLAFVFFFLRDSLLPSLVVIALMGLFFPSIMFIAVGVMLLRVVHWDGLRPRLSSDKRDYLACAATLAVTALVLLPYAFRSSGFGPVVTASEARMMPEFLPRGRMVVFRQGFWSYWITGSHTGMFTSGIFAPITMCLGLALPLLFVFRKRFPLANRISNGVEAFPRIIVASLAIFLAANLLLFRLYLPSRFTVSSFRILLALAAGISAIVLLDAAFRWAKQRTLPAVAAAVLAGAALILFPVEVDTRYKIGEAPALYEYLSRQPKSTLIASLSNETDNLPIFAGRSVLVARESALPFHKGYYSQIRQRAGDLINAQYAADITELQGFMLKYGVNYLLVDRNAFTPEYLAGDKWIMQYQPAAKDAVARMNQGIVPALSRLVEQCAAFEGNGMVLISADCVSKAAAESATHIAPAPVSPRPR
ncbi:MAG TPA: hypothetical protein VNS63_07770 [Blastocatellia bacterium]|nr:hypothetical protein [Blastocatellia bacterium]